MKELDKKQKVIAAIGGAIIVSVTAFATFQGVDLDAEKAGNIAATSALQESLASCRTENNSLKQKIIEARADPTLLEQIFRGLATP